MSKPSDLFPAAYFFAYPSACPAEAKAIVWEDNYFLCHVSSCLITSELRKAGQASPDGICLPAISSKKLCLPCFIQAKSLNIPIRFR